MKSTLQSTSQEPKKKGREWRPFPRQEIFLSSDIFEVLFGGSKGPGKTECLLMEGLRQINKPYYRGIIFRRTSPKLREIIDRSLKYFQYPPLNGVYKSQENCWNFPSGAKIYFGYCQYEQDKYNFQGHEYHYMAFDQLEEFTENQYLFLIAQVRSTDPEIRTYVRSTANPGNVGHVWVKDRFIDKLDPDGNPKYFKRINNVDTEVGPDDPKGMSRAFVFSTLDDNPALMENDPTYENRLQMMDQKDFKALRWGDWNIFSGQYFNEWTPHVHIIEPFLVPSYWKRFISLDYGHSKPASVGWWAVTPEGKLIRYREIYKEKLHYDTLADLICELSENEKINYLVSDPAIFGDKEHHSKKKEAREGLSGAEVMQETINEWFKAKGREDEAFLITRGDNRRIPGWGNVRLYLKVYEDEKGDEDSNLKVFSTCTSFTKTFPANVHDQRRPEDLDTNGEDHTADETRYGVQSIPPKTETEFIAPVHPHSAKGRADAIRRRRMRR